MNSVLHIAVAALLLPLGTTSANAQSMELTGLCDGLMNLDATGLSPGGTWAILTADDAGSTQLPPGPCAGTWIGLDGTWQMYATGPVDNLGEVHVGAVLGPAACDLAVQVVDANTCSTTNVAVVGDGATWADSFENGIGPNYTLGGDRDWWLSPWGYHDATKFRAGSISDSQTSTLSIVLDFPAGGNISFWHEGGTEQAYDFFKFRIDGVQVAQFSGMWSWTQTVVPVTPGVHAFEWSYTKDGSQACCGDFVALDLVQAYGAIPP